MAKCLDHAARQMVLISVHMKTPSSFFRRHTSGLSAHPPVFLCRSCFSCPSFRSLPGDSCLTSQSAGSISSPQKLPFLSQGPAHFLHSTYGYFKPHMCVCMYMCSRAYSHLSVTRDENPHKGCECGWFVIHFQFPKECLVWKTFY